MARRTTRRELTPEQQAEADRVHAAMPRPPRVTSGNWRSGSPGLRARGLTGGSARGGVTGMPNGGAKNWVRVCAAVDRFRVRYGRWPERVRVMPVAFTGS